MRLGIVILGCSLLLAISAFALVPQRGAPPDLDKDPFVGVTTNGTVMPGLFAIRSTGVTTRPVMQAAAGFIAALTSEQRKTTTFPVDDSEWRRWNNVHRAARAGLAFKDMTDEQRTRAFDLLKAGLSARGLEKTRNVMKLNHTIAELTNNFTEYGEGLYNMTVMGEPSPTEPWGWQLEGHHLIVNYFVLGDQVVMTPTFMGSEPVSADAGKYAGTTVLQDEQHKGLALMQALTAPQQQKALIETGKKIANKSQAQAYRDNLQLAHAGIEGSELNPQQRTLLSEVVAEYVHNMSDGHAKVRMAEVRTHLDDTYFGWIGETTPDAVFYYRIHSPVILIEFDHQTPVALKGPREAGRAHIHSVVRTPNGNDYGKDLLRLHYQKHAHDVAHGHR
ncbi:DUF3500 domain-containing protein [soil metagenome]